MTITTFDEIPQAIRAIQATAPKPTEETGGRGSMKQSTLIPADRVLVGIESRDEIESLLDDLSKLFARLYILRTVLRCGLRLRPEVAFDLRGQLYDFGKLALRLTDSAAELPVIDPYAGQADEPIIVCNGEQG